MTYVEYAMYDIDLSEVDVQSNFEKVSNSHITCVSVPFYYTKLLLKNEKITISNAIDYPLGISDIKTRNSAIINSINNGAQKIDIVFQNTYLSNKKYDKIRQDISSNLEICNKANVPLFYYLEYRIFTHQSLIKACNLLLEHGLDKIYVSTGHLLDDISDNIVAYNLLKQKTNIQPIFTANIWTKEHVKALKKNDIKNLRFNNINAIRTYYEYS